MHMSVAVECKKPASQLMEHEDMITSAAIFQRPGQGVWY